MTAEPGDDTHRPVVRDMVGTLQAATSDVVLALRAAIRDSAPVPLRERVDHVATRHMTRMVPAVLDRMRDGAGLAPAQLRVLHRAGRDMVPAGIPLTVGLDALRAAIGAFSRIVVEQAAARPGYEQAAVVVLDRAIQISHEITQAISAGYTSGVAPAWAQVLAPVARRILELAAQGYSTRQIAQDLHYSDQAVTYHLGRMMRQFGVTNRTALIAVAVHRRAIVVPTQPSSPAAVPTGWRGTAARGS